MFSQWREGARRFEYLTHFSRFQAEMDQGSVKLCCQIRISDVQRMVGAARLETQGCFLLVSLTSNPSSGPDLCKRITILLRVSSAAVGALLALRMFGLDVNSIAMIGIWLPIGSDSFLGGINAGSGFPSPSPQPLDTS